MVQPHKLLVAIEKIIPTKCLVGSELACNIDGSITLSMYWDLKRVKAYPIVDR